jgi:hypothetical protein
MEIAWDGHYGYTNQMKSWKFKNYLRKLLFLLKEESSQNNKIQFKIMWGL